MTATEEYQLNPYLGWQKEQGIPIHTGFFVEDLERFGWVFGKPETPAARSSICPMRW